jgi:tryptophanyl-tRNA synthetase
MGKSLGNAIYLCDNEDTIRKKIMSAITDPNKIKKDDPANPDICMVNYYHKLIGNDNIEKLCNECKKGTRGCVQCKKELINEMNNFLSDVRTRRKYYEENPELVDKILNEGTEKARQIAKEQMAKVKHAMKIDY